MLLFITGILQYWYGLHQFSDKPSENKTVSAFTPPGLFSVMSSCAYLAGRWGWVDTDLDGSICVTLFDFLVVRLARFVSVPGIRRVRFLSIVQTATSGLCEGRFLAIWRSAFTYRSIKIINSNTDKNRNIHPSFMQTIPVHMSSICFVQTFLLLAVVVLAVVLLVGAAEAMYCRDKWR